MNRLFQLGGGVPGRPPIINQCIVGMRSSPLPFGLLELLLELLLLVETMECLVLVGSLGDQFLNSRGWWGDAYVPFKEGTSQGSVKLEHENGT